MARGVGWGTDETLPAVVPRDEHCDAVEAASLDGAQDGPPRRPSGLSVVAEAVLIAHLDVRAPRQTPASDPWRVGHGRTNATRCLRDVVYVYATSVLRRWSPPPSLTLYAKQLCDADASPASDTNAIASAALDTGAATATNLDRFTSVSILTRSSSISRAPSPASSVPRVSPRGPTASTWRPLEPPPEPRRAAALVVDLPLAERFAPRVMRATRSRVTARPGGGGGCAAVNDMTLSNAPRRTEHRAPHAPTFIVASSEREKRRVGREAA